MPAALLGLERGLAPGLPADLVLLRPVGGAPGGAGGTGGMTRDGIDEHGRLDGGPEALAVERVMIAGQWLAPGRRNPVDTSGPSD